MLKIKINPYTFPAESHIEPDNKVIEIVAQSPPSVNRCWQQVFLFPWMRTNQKYSCIIWSYL